MAERASTTRRTRRAPPTSPLSFRMPTTLRSRLRGLPYGDQGSWVRRALFCEIDGYRASPFMEDLDFVWRLRRRAPPAIGGPAVATSARRWEREGIARTTVANWCAAGAFVCGGDPWLFSNSYARMAGGMERA